MIPESSNSRNAPDIVEMVEAKGFGIVKRYRQGEVLFWQNEPVNRLFLVKTGSIKTCTISEGGKSLTYGIWGRGTILGVTAHFLDEDHLSTARVQQSSDVLIVSPADFGVLVKSEMAFSLAVIRYLARFVEIFLHEVEALSFLGVQERLKRSLERLAADHGRATPEGIQIDLAVTHQEIAELSSTTRSTITTYLNDLKKQGYLSSAGRNLVILPSDHIRILENLAEAVMMVDMHGAGRWVWRAIHKEIDLVKVLDVLARTLREAEVQATDKKTGSPDIGAVAAVARGVLAILLAKFAADQTARPLLGTAVIGTLQGDTHDLGKLMACVLLACAGYQVVDLGVDVAWEQFAAAVQEHRPTVLAIWSTMDVDRRQQECARKVFDAGKILDQVALVVGGVGFSDEKAAELGALGYAGSLPDTIKLVQVLGCQGQDSGL